MREHAAVKFVDLLLRLLTGELLRIVDQQADDFRIVDVALPELPCEFVVPTDLLGQLSQLRQTDAEALELTGLDTPLLPVRNATFVSVLFQECEDLGLCHGLYPTSEQTPRCAVGSSELRWS